MAVLMAVQPTASRSLAQRPPSWVAPLAFWRLGTRDVLRRVPDTPPDRHPKRPTTGHCAGLKLRQIWILDDPRYWWHMLSVLVPDNLQAVIEILASHTHHRRPAARIDRGKVKVKPVPVHLSRPPSVTRRTVPAGRQGAASVRASATAPLPEKPISAVSPHMVERACFRCQHNDPPC